MSTTAGMPNACVSPGGNCHTIGYRSTVIAQTVARIARRGIPA